MEWHERMKEVYPELYGEGYKWVTNCDGAEVNYRIGAYVENGLEVRVGQTAFDIYGRTWTEGKAIFTRENKNLSKN